MEALVSQQISSVSSAPDVVPVVSDVVHAVPDAHADAKEIIRRVSALRGDALRVALASALREFAQHKPVKPVFSTDKAERKAQMRAFADADRVFRSALGMLFRFAEDVGADHKDRHAASVSASGIVSLRRSETLTLRPAKSARITL